MSAAMGATLEELLNREHEACSHGWAILTLVDIWFGDALDSLDDVDDATFGT